MACLSDTTVQETKSAKKGQAQLPARVFLFILSKKV